jgi:hypothetical protein
MRVCLVKYQPIQDSHYTALFSLNSSTSAFVTKYFLTSQFDRLDSSVSVIKLADLEQPCSSSELCVNVTLGIEIQEFQEYKQENAGEPIGSISVWRFRASTTGRHI